MSSTYMGAILKSELSSDSCGQEVRSLLDEYDSIMYKLELEEFSWNEWKRKLFEFASR